MRIVKIEIWTVVVPTIAGRVYSDIYGPTGWDMVPKHIICMHTDDGLFGLGETGRGVPLGGVQQLAAQIEGRDPRKMILQQLPEMLGRIDEEYPQASFNRWWEGIAFDDGYALVPDKPGLGCELDMDALERYSINK